MYWSRQSWKSLLYVTAVIALSLFVKLHLPLEFSTPGTGRDFNNTDQRLTLIQTWIPMPVEFDLWNICMPCTLWSTPEDAKFKENIISYPGKSLTVTKYQTRTNLIQHTKDVIWLWGWKKKYYDGESNELEESGRHNGEDGILGRTCVELWVGLCIWFWQK